jgi:hypothetical protein
MAGTAQGTIATPPSSGTGFWKGFATGSLLGRTLSDGDEAKMMGRDKTKADGSVAGMAGDSLDRGVLGSGNVGDGTAWDRRGGNLSGSADTSGGGGMGTFLGILIALAVLGGIGLFATRNMAGAGRKMEMPAKSRKRMPMPMGKAGGDDLRDLSIQLMRGG